MFLLTVNSSTDAFYMLVWLVICRCTVPISCLFIFYFFNLYAQLVQINETILSFEIRHSCAHRIRLHSDPSGAVKALKDYRKIAFSVLQPEVGLIGLLGGMINVSIYNPLLESSLDRRNRL